MEMENHEVQKLDLYVFFDDFFKVARRYILLGLILAILCGCGFAANVRGENLSIPEFARLADAIGEYCSKSA